MKNYPARILITVVLGCLSLLCNHLHAQTLDNSLVRLLRNEKVIKDLNIDDEQTSRIRELESGMMEKVRKTFIELRDSGGDRRLGAAELKEMIEKTYEVMAKDVHEILTPEQSNRLKQLLIQAQIQRSGIVDALSETNVGKLLDVTEEQKVDLNAKANEVNKELEIKIAELRENAEKEILSVLTMGQQEKLEELRGEQLDLGNPEPGRRGTRGRGARSFPVLPRDRF